VLDKEWDIERVLEVNASTLALTGLILGLKQKSKMAIPAQPCVAVSFAAWLARLVSSLTPLTPVWYSYPGRDRP